MAEEVEDTFDKLKAGAKVVAKKVTDPDKDLGEEYEKKEINRSDYEVENTDTENREPMSPEKISFT